MRGVASAHPSAGARTCVVLGALDRVEDLDLRPYRLVLWWSHRGAIMPARLGMANGNVAFEAIEDLDRIRAGQILDRFIEKDPLHVPALFVTDDAAADAAFLSLADEIVAQFENASRVRATRQADGFLWQRQLLENLAAYASHRVPASWAGALEGVPALICGAGPSLNTSVAKLAECAPCGVVFAADSALRVLSERQVRVDFALSIDAHKTPQKCVPPGIALPERMVLSSVSPPAWRQTVPSDRQFFLSGRQLTEDWLAQSGVAKTPVMAVENCGIAALELAVFLGCRPIYLFGMDHAVDSKDPTKWHQGSVPDDLHDHVGFSAQKVYPKVPGNFQAEIATPLFREWRALDALCAGYPSGLVVNVIDRGARLRNTTIVHPDSLSMENDPVEKHAGIARLGGREGRAAANIPPPLLEQVHAAVERTEPYVAQARAQLAAGNVTGALAHLTAAFRDKAFSMIMGNYCLKIMPHLLRPDSSNCELWNTLVAEIEQLVAFAKALR